MYSPIDSSDEIILRKAIAMSKSWASGHIDGQHRRMIRDIIKDRGIDFNPKKIPLSPPPKVLKSILRSSPKIYLYEKTIEPKKMWFKPFSNSLIYSPSFDYNYTPVEYSVRLIVDETITLTYESLIVDINDNCNNLLGIELILDMLRRASLRDIRFIWFRMNLKRSKPEEFDMIVQLLEHIKVMPQVIKTLITGIPKEGFSPSLNQTDPIRFYSNIKDLKLQLK